MVNTDSVALCDMVPMRVFFGRVCDRFCALIIRTCALLSLMFSNVCGININFDMYSSDGSSNKSLACPTGDVISIKVCECGGKVIWLIIKAGWFVRLGSTYGIEMRCSCWSGMVRRF